MHPVRVILNPQAAGGTALDRTAALDRALDHVRLPHAIVLTRTRGHATELARAAIRDGVELVVVAGGDGTLNEVVQAFVEPGAPPPEEAPALGVLPCGTGNDFTKCFAMSEDLREAAARLRYGPRRRVDVGRATFQGRDGAETTRAFVNVLSVGLGGEVDRRKAALPPWLGGRAVFFATSVQALVGYDPAGVRVEVDGEVRHEGRMLAVAVANGRFFGGGMKIAPHADPTDGRLEIVCVRERTLLGASLLAPALYRGAHLGAEGVEVSSGRRVRVTPIHAYAEVPVDVDGEALGVAPLALEVVPRAVTLVG